MTEAIEILIADTFDACRVRDDTMMELACIEEIARLMAETKKVEMRR